MDINLLSKIFRELILEHDRVSLPGVGSFIAEVAPSVFSDRGLIIHPPFRRILFRTSEIWNDGMFQKKYAEERGVTDEIAGHEIAKFVKELKHELNTNKSFKIPDFGSMRATEQNDYFFVADKELFNYLESFGLVPVNIKVLSKRGELERLSGKATPGFFKNKERALYTGKIEEIYEPEQYAVDSESSLENFLDFSDDQLLIINGEVTQVVNIQEPETEQGIESEIILEPKSEFEMESEIEPESETDFELSYSAVPESISREDSKVRVYSNTDKNEYSKNSFFKKILTTLIVIFSLLIAIVLIYIFKEELRPLLEWILYSKEERELLNL